jgi:hypothetical protein
MRHFWGASGAVLVAAMTISLAPLCQAARAFDDKPVVRSMMDRNTVLPPSALSPNIITVDTERYMNPLNAWKGSLR